jgi:hypothetical protein
VVRTSARPAEWDVFALGLSEALVPRLALHHEPHLIDVHPVAVMHVVAATELGITELLSDPQRGDDVGAQLEARELQIEVVEEVAM